MSPTLSQPPSEELSLKIAKKVAESKGVDPATLTPPLHSVIDVEALDRLFESTKDGPRMGRVTFEYGGYTVEVMDTNDVTVTVHDER